MSISDSTKKNIKKKYGSDLGDKLISTTEAGLTESESTSQIKNRLDEVLQAELADLTSEERELIIDNIITYVFVG